MPNKPEASPPPPTPDNDAFLAWLETVRDPEERYSIATSTLEEFQETVSRLSALRADAVAAASQEEPVSSVARRFGVSRQRAYQLIRESRARDTTAPEPASDRQRRAGRRKGTKKS
jgi:hypothetical protein